MKRPYAALLLLLLAGLGCSLTRADDKGEITTPTPIGIISSGGTPAATLSPTPNPNATNTPVPAPPTRLPTLFPTPQQFNTPVVPGAVRPPTVVASAGGGSASSGGAGQIAAAGGDPAVGAPQNNGFYFPNTIVYSSGGSLRAVGRDGSGGGVIGSGSVATRSLNGLFIASGSVLVRPDGQKIGVISGQTTTPAWSRDNSTAYFGSGANLMRYQNGTTTAVNSTLGDLIKVEFSPDGGTLLFASRNQIKLLHGDGAVSVRWDSTTETVSDGPYWATRGEQFGLYFTLNNGRRIFLNGGLSEVTDPNERLQLQSPVNPYARVYIRADNGGSLTLVAVWPEAPDREFVAPSLADVSWSPDSAQLVYASMGGELVVLDAASGGSQVIASGGARFPVWSPPRYLVKN